MRDFDRNPYSPDEKRVAKWFSEHGTGGGDDPIGALIASHEYLAAERNELRRKLAFERQLIAHRTSAAIQAVKARAKDGHWGPAVYMTEERIKRVGDYLNGRNGKPKLSGPKVAKKLGVSTASIYAHWKQSGHGRFVRKKPEK